MASSESNNWVPCAQCPLLQCRGLRPLDAPLLAFMQEFKQGEMRVDRGAQVLVQGSKSPHLYTVLEGVLMRYRLLEDGRRQILNFVFPGDLLGLQVAMGEPISHGVESLTPATLCVFQRDRFEEMIVTHPALAYDVIWLAAKEEQALEEHLVSLGQRSASERIAYLAVFLVERAKATGVADGNTIALSVTQSQIADMLGLSLVHTNRTLQSLRRSNLISWNLGGIAISDLDAARDFAGMDGEYMQSRPFF
ncbi:Crp/Fnr family transcriptional regulator [Novosphingobium tardum]|jgi:CRP-like cAMP-binding protein|uniref:Crp/Fnr family transcriptional regulator n=1 Tax=Novosphingobium tardum TaxID=1538021 RepID=A0ABV8RLF8_9SPHN